MEPTGSPETSSVNSLRPCCKTRKSHKRVFISRAKLTIKTFMWFYQKHSAFFNHPSSRLTRSYQGRRHECRWQQFRRSKLTASSTRIRSRIATGGETLRYHRRRCEGLDKTSAPTRPKAWLFSPQCNYIIIHSATNQATTHYMYSVEFGNLLICISQ